MRKVLIATIVAMVLFAVGAFAASFVLAADNVASDDADVLACDDAVSVDLKGGEFSTTAGDWIVTEAKLTGINVGTGGCSGAAVEVVVISGSVTATATGTVNGATVTLSDFDNDAPVKSVSKVYVLLDGVLAA